VTLQDPHRICAQAGRTARILPLGGGGHPLRAQQHAGGLRLRRRVGERAAEPLSGFSVSVLLVVLVLVGGGVGGGGGRARCQGGWNEVKGGVVRVLRLLGSEQLHAESRPRPALFAREAGAGTQGGACGVWGVVAVCGGGGGALVSWAHGQKPPPPPTSGGDLAHSGFVRLLPVYCLCLSIASRSV
jgi:hypothetical protein